MNGADPLAQLRDYHLPEPVSWWPPAPGWWLLAGLLLMAMLGLGWWLLRRRKRRAPLRAARAELQALHADWQLDGDDQDFAKGLSQLLRRYALSRFPRKQVAGLSGEDWLNFLDAHGGDGHFSNGPGRLILNAVSRPDVKVPVEQLMSLAKAWLGRNPEVRS